MPDHEFLLRIEATNLNRFVWDTADLSTIRGSSLALLQWPHLVAKLLSERGLDSEVITVGGSAMTIVLPKISGDDPSETVRQHLAESLKRLRTDELFGLVTYAGAAVEIHGAGGYSNAMQLVLSSIRLQQSSEADMLFPAENTDADTTSFCALNRLLPSTEKVVNGSRVSPSVATRRKKGLQEKRELVRILTDTETETTADFGEMTTGCEFARRSDTCGKNLNGFMAVIVLDGNGFGDIEQQQSTSKEHHSKWDYGLRTARKQFLSQLVAHASENPDRWKNSDRLRFETLLWGGDEQVWVVPAWVALELIEFFYRATTKDAWKGLSKGRRITHCGGVVLCHHKAPIRDAVELAHRLLETAKRCRTTLAEQNCFCYQILESFDHLGESFDLIRRQQRPVGMLEVDTVLDHGALLQLIRFREDAESWLPATRRQRIQRALFSRDWLQYSGELERLIEVAREKESVIRAISDAVQKWHRLHQPSKTHLTDHGVLPQAQSFWYHALELWDYIVPGYAVGRRTRT